MKKTILSSIIGLSLIFILLMSATLPSAVVYAVDGDVAPNYVFDKIDVTKDLEGSDGFDFSDYPADASKDTQIYTFLEYGYDGTDNSKFGLYLYIYNPQQKDFSRSSASNKANVAVAFDEKDNASSYQRVNLIFCSATSDKLFYKYRIDDSDGKLLALAEQYAITHAGARRYDVATVELFAYGNTTATTTSIGKSYECAGYMKGFGADKASNTHSVKAYSLDVLDIELNHTFFRPEGNSSAQSDYTVKDQLDSVYFSFPNELIEQYGGIWKIEASYYSAMTSPILVTSTKEVYDTVLKYVGQQLTKNNDKRGKNEKLNKGIPFVLYDSTYSDDSLAPLRPINCRLDWNHNAKVGSVPIEDQIVYYLFYTGYETSDASTPYAKDFTLSGERLLDYIYNYNKSYRFGKSELLNDKGEQLSMDMFQGYMPNGETTQWFDQNVEIVESGQMIYVPIEITADENYTIESYKRKPTAFDWFKLYKGVYDYDRFDVQAIEPIDVRDVDLPKEEFCKKYYFDVVDYDNVIARVRDGIKNEQTVYMFRFAQSQYTAKGVYTEGEMSLGQEYAYVAEENVYLNMNVASITCRKNDVYHTFAVASNPINAVADIEPNKPYDNAQFYKDVWQKIKNWFEDNKKELIISAIVIVCVLIAICIISLLVKLAPYFAMQSMKRSQSSPKPKRQSKPKRQRQSKPHKNKSNKKTAQKAGRRKHGN